MCIYIAHKKAENAGEISIQTVKDHCIGVSRIMRESVIDELNDVAELCGLYHDIGKYQASFQKRVRGDVIEVEHATCGGQAVREYFKQKRLKETISDIVAICDVGHHTGIPDMGTLTSAKKATFRERMSRDFEDYSMYKKELKPPVVDVDAFIDFVCKDCDSTDGKINEMLLMDKMAFITRYLYSALVDADSLDTMKFESENIDTHMVTDFSNCLDDINNRLKSFKAGTELQKAREALQKQVFENTEDGEIYLMNMPTGSGKTLCSMKFALDMAIREKKKHIIYVIPYNSIIDQTALEFERTFGGHANILRHQSTYSGENSDCADDVGDKGLLRLAVENWDADIIITTAVQFFESFYSNKRGKLRKIHNIADSILIFDEAHLMPHQFFQPCIEAIAFTVRFLHSKAVLLTATMPDYSSMISKFTVSNIKIIELIKNKTAFKYFKKCQFKSIGVVSIEKLIMSANNNASALVVVNKKKTAKKIYDLCSGEKYYLSTYLTGYDREQTIFKIRSSLVKLAADFPSMKDVPENRRILVISTSLIEAGVDFDFTSAYRELNGLDNIIQTGGRCNREGKLENAFTYVFEFEEDSQVSTRESNITKAIVRDYKDLSSEDAINEYYKKLYDSKNDILDSNTIHNGNYGDYRTIAYKKYAEDFKIINNDNVSLVIPEDDYSSELCDSLEYAEYTGGIARKLQKYTCSISQHEFELLKEQNAMVDCKTNFQFAKETSSRK